MAGLNLHLSPSVEQLTDEFLALPRPNQADILQNRTVVVENRGMERYLRLTIARKQGVAAGLEFPFLNPFLHRIFHRIKPGSFPFDRQLATWRIFNLFDFNTAQSLLHRPEFVAVKRYLSGEHPIKRYQLASQTANLYDRYAIKHPDILQRWRDPRIKIEDPDELWQAALWHQLTENYPDQTPVDALRILEQSVELLKTDSSIPSTIYLFGISSLPQLHLQVIMQLARAIEIHIFLLTAVKLDCTEFVYPNSLMQQLTQRFGMVGRKFIRNTIDRASEMNLPLQLHQSNLTKISPDGALAKQAGAGPDPSHRAVDPDYAYPELEIHACHTPLREVEVLHNRLLKLFMDDPSLQPGDILVMSPNIEEFAPLLHAIFNDPERKPIPHHIADRHAPAQLELRQALELLFDFADGRFTAPEFISLLEDPLLLRCSLIERNEIDTIRRWIEISGIRWGYDRQLKNELGVPSGSNATWQRGLEALMLGFAIGEGRPLLFEQQVAMPGVSEGSIDLLGRFYRFVNRLEQVRQLLSQTASVEQWIDRINQTIELMQIELDPDSPLFTVFQNLSHYQAATNGPLLLPPIAINEEILSHFKESSHGSGFLQGGVTFSSFMPMRSIPFRVVVLMGMDEGRFPGQELRPNFDLIGKGVAGEPGEQLYGRREDDLQLLLETILCAKERLVVLYRGFNPVTGERRHPAIPISEFQEMVIAASDRPTNATGEVARPAAQEQLHRFHGFHPAYLNGESEYFYSFYPTDLSNAQHRQNKIDQIPPFHPPALALPIDSDSPLTIALERLISFAKNSARHYLRSLSIFLPRPDEEPADVESFTTDSLQKNQIMQQLIHNALSQLRPASPQPAGSVEPEQLRTLFAFDGKIPDTSGGDALLNSYASTVNMIIKAIDPGRCELREINLSIPLNEGHTLTYSGEILIRENQLIVVLSSSLREARLVEHWIRYCMVRSHSLAESLIIYSCDKDGNLSVNEYNPIPVADARNYLIELAGLYFEGMGRPLPFFPDLSTRFIKEHNKQAGGRSATDAAADTRPGTGKTQSDILAGIRATARNPRHLYDYSAPEVEWSFRGIELFDDPIMASEFVRCARTILAPIMAATPEQTDGK